MQKLKGFTYGLLLFSLGFNALDIFAEEPQVYQEDEVVVTATRTSEEKKETPGTTEVITKEEIDASGANTVAELLDKKGVVISTNGGTANAATVQLDGFSAGQTLVLVNGIPANTGSLGTVDLSYFPLSGIQKIEIVHGPLSALYGSNALGGVVNIITDLTGDPKTNLVMSGGSFNTGKIALGVQQRKFGIAVGGLYTEGDRERSRANMEHLLTQYDVYQNDTGYLTVNLGYWVKDSQSPGSLTYHPEADEYAKNGELDLRGQTRYGDWIWDYKVFGQSVRYHYDEVGQASSRYRTYTSGFDLAGQYSSGSHNFLNGFTLRRDDSKSTITGEHTLDNGALFLQDEWKISGQWKLVSGVRWDTGSVFSSPLMPRISLIHQATENLTLKLGFGKAFRSPTVNDLYYPADSWGMVGNPDLQPEISKRYEFSGEWKVGSQLLTMNAFRANVENGIEWQYDATEAKTMPVNITKMHVNGLILSWQKQLNKVMSTGIRYSWIDKSGWDETSASYCNDLNYFGKHQLTYDIKLDYGDWTGGLDWHWVAKRSIQSVYEMPDYHLLNLNIGYRANAKLSYQLSINNVFDKEYQIHHDYPMPGREIIMSLNHTF